MCDGFRIVVSGPLLPYPTIIRRSLLTSAGADVVECLP